MYVTVLRLFYLIYVYAMLQQARSRGGSLGAEESPSLNKRSTILLKGPLFCLKSHNFV